MDTQLQLPIRNAGLYSALRRFVIEAFALLATDREAGADISFSVAEHRKLRDERPFYEYRPMTERFVSERIDRIWELEAADDAVWTVTSDPACSTFLRAGRADQVADLQIAAKAELLVPMLVSMSEVSPDFELDEAALLEHYLRFEKVLYSDARRYVAMTPMWGLRLMYGDLELAPGVTLRAVDPEGFRMEWPEAAQLDWGDGSKDGLPTAMLQFERQVGPDDDETAIDPLRAIVDVTSAIRALAGGSVAAGPLVLERFDWRTLAPRPVPAVAARRCGHLPSKVDGTVAKHLPTALRRLSSDPDGTLARAVERYQFAATAHGMAALRALFDMLIEIYAREREVGSAALRIAVVLGTDLPDRRAYVDAMHLAAKLIQAGDPPGPESVQVTRTLAAALRATIAAGLIGELPVTSLAAYADAIVIGERERRQLGIATMGAEPSA
ncbi:MAG: hypothetical protein JWM25_584 [Thermoleophilia bacterium]|nr:hypothetical protein [Thermoleophilia bacterium]MCZ4496001.1 hypothetical protein [Thermoleophilia bacterium]